MNIQKAIEVLGLKLTDDQATIEQKYKKLCLKYHPDRNVGKTQEEIAKNEALFKEIQSAYDVIKTANYVLSSPFSHNPTFSSFNRNAAPRPYTRYDVYSDLFNNYSPFANRSYTYNPFDNYNNSFNRASNTLSAYSFCQKMANLSSAERCRMYEISKDYLPRMINDIYDFYHIIKHLDLKQCAEISRKRRPVLLREYSQNYGSSLRVITFEKHLVIINALIDEWSAADLNNFLKELPPMSRNDVYNKLKKPLWCIVHLEHLCKVIQYLTLEQSQEICSSYELQSHDKFDHIFQSNLSSKHRAVVLNSFVKNISPSHCPDNKISQIIPYLGEDQLEYVVGYVEGRKLLFNCYPALFTGIVYFDHMQQMRLCKAFNEKRLNSINSFIVKYTQHLAGLSLIALPLLCFQPITLAAINLVSALGNFLLGLTIGVSSSLILSLAVGSLAIIGAVAALGLAYLAVYQISKKVVTSDCVVNLQLRSMNNKPADMPSATATNAPSTP